MVFRFLFAISLLFAFSNTKALELIGNAPGFEGRYIRIYAVSDFISHKEVKLDVVRIDADGQFHLNAHLIDPTIIKLKIDDKSVDLIAKPNFKLKIQLSFNEEENSNRLYDRSLTVKVIDKSDEGINALIFSYQKIYAAFIEENQAALITKKMLPKVQSFRTEMVAEYSNAPAYFKIYLNYELASLEDAVLGSEKYLFANYIQNKAILYGNVAYMKFFRQFYQERFIQISQGKKGFDMLSAVNGTQNYERMMELIMEHPYVDNDTIAQLFALQGLKEVYGDETFKKDKVVSMLQVIEKKALNSENQRIASNILDEIFFLKSGQKAPDFTLRDAVGDVHHLSDSKGKVVLLFFWSAYSKTCLREFEFIEEYQTKYTKDLEVIAINLDSDPSKSISYLSKQDYSVQVLFKDNQFDLIDKYRVYSVPTYTLINRQMFIERHNALRPEENLEGEIFKLISKN